MNDPRAAKQTETTQRFRVRLVLSSGQRLPTKVEFSRRSVDDGVVTDRIDPEVARRHNRTAYLCEHYDATGAARKKSERWPAEPRRRRETCSTSTYSIRAAP